MPRPPHHRSISMTILSPRASTVSATIHPVSVGSVGPSDFTVYAKGPMVRKMSGRVKWRIRGAKRLDQFERSRSTIKNESLEITESRRI